MKENDPFGMLSDDGRFIPGEKSAVPFEDNFIEQMFLKLYRAEAGEFEHGEHGAVGLEHASRSGAAKNKCFAKFVKRRAFMAEKTESGRKKVVRELSRLAFMEPEEGCRIKISEKMKALELLGKCLDLFDTPEPADSDLNVEIKVIE